MIFKEIVKGKLQLLICYLHELKKFSDIGYDVYVSSNKRTVERLIELIVECGSDISGYILSLYSGTAPDSYYMNFSLLGEKGIFKEDISIQLAKYGSLCNRNIHEYGTYKDEMIHP